MKVFDYGSRIDGSRRRNIFELRFDLDRYLCGKKGVYSMVKLSIRAPIQNTVSMRAAMGGHE